MSKRRAKFVIRIKMPDLLFFPFKQIRNIVLFSFTTDPRDRTRLYVGYYLSCPVSLLQTPFWGSFEKEKKNGINFVSCPTQSHTPNATQFFCVGIGELTGNPTATLSSEILFFPAWNFTFSVNVNLLCSLVPRADPAIVKHNIIS